MLPGVIYEDLPRVPLYPVPIDQAGTEDLLKPGAHLVYKVCRKEPCRPCYRSALVLKVEGTKIHVIMNTSEHDETEHDKTEHEERERNKTEQKGVKAECLEYSRTDYYIIKYSHCCEYSHCRYTDDVALTRAEQRLEWGEEEYHCLYNNSHHFVTWAKTGRESSLADIIESLTYQTGNGVIDVCKNAILHFMHVFGIIIAFSNLLLDMLNSK